MVDLLSSVIDAHGGLDRWSAVDAVTARITIGGVAWEAKGQPDIVGPKTVEVDTRRERIGLTPFAAADWDLELYAAPERVVVTDREGAVVEERTTPRSMFAGSDMTSRWDMLQAGYFIGYALWNYLTEPFLLSYPGVEAHEIDSSEQEGDTWRRLRVTFPETVATDNVEQVYYFDSTGIQRRKDYDLEIDGNVPVAHYTDEPKTFDGIVVPTARRVRRRMEDGDADMAEDYITIDIHHVAYRTL
jgi:hypothetical protein